MAGFAVNLDLVRRYPNATMMYKAGYEEDSFLRELHVDADQMEARAANCTEILVWHTQTVQAKTASLLPYADPSGSSVAALLDSMSRQNLVVFTEKGSLTHPPPNPQPPTPPPLTAPTAATNRTIAKHDWHLTLLNLTRFYST